jgi:hypothetical protein
MTRRPLQGGATPGAVQAMNAAIDEDRSNGSRRDVLSGADVGPASGRLRLPSGDAVVRIDARAERIVHTIPVGTGPLQPSTRSVRFGCESFTARSRASTREQRRHRHDRWAAHQWLSLPQRTCLDGVHQRFAIDPATNLVARRIASAACRRIAA